MSDLAAQPIQEAFRRQFRAPAAAWAHAPGRVNLLGEHTDYNGGFVLPTALRQQTWVALAPSRDGQHRFHAASLGKQLAVPVGEAGEDFARYLTGCLVVAGMQAYPLWVYIQSDVPVAAGLSSSAALEVAFLRALRRLYQRPWDDLAVAQLAQRAEVEQVGVRVGIMDQMASSLADDRHMLWLDTQSLETRLLPLPPQSEVLVLDSGTQRQLASSGYNQRRSECEQACALLGVSSLRQVERVSDLAALPSPLLQRARHVVSENARVLAALSTDAPGFGRLMNASHQSLRDDYAVSVPSLDALVELQQLHPEVYGARLTGAGFGGCTVALVREGAAARVGDQVLAGYRSRGFSGGRRVTPPPADL